MTDVEGRSSDPRLPEQTLDLVGEVFHINEARDWGAATNLLADYAPYAKQRAFHAAGATHRERLFMAGNKLGKSLAGAMEVAMHLTGRYPGWWDGKRFDRPTRWWAASNTGETTRDNPQQILLGPPEQEERWGTGAIPHDALVAWSRSRGVANALATAVVAHVSGGRSAVTFKSYDQGREKWQGPNLHGVWFLDLRGDVKKMVDVVTTERIASAADRQVIEEHGRRITNLEQRPSSAAMR